MSKNNNSKTAEGEKFVINIEEHPPFDPIVETKYISSDDFCKLVSDLFRAVYADFEGCEYAINQQGRGAINLFFNHSEPDDNDRFNGITRTMPDKNGSNLKNDTVRRIRQHDSYNRNGDRYFLTEQGAEGISKFIFDNMYVKKDGTISWDKLTAEVSQGQRYFNQQPIVYTKISMLDPDKLAAAIFGPTNEDGDNLCYAVNMMRSIPQMVIPNCMGGGMQPQFMLYIQKVSEKEVAKLCNQCGVAPNQGLNIIR